MYTEASSPRQQGDKAFLRTKVRLGDDRTDKCLRLWYHMYGNQIGSLAVLLGDEYATSQTQVLRGMSPSNFLKFNIIPILFVSLEFLKKLLLVAWVPVHVVCVLHNYLSAPALLQAFWVL